jgi:hypothetical protein
MSVSIMHLQDVNTNSTPADLCCCLLLPAAAAAAACPLLL